MVGAETPAAAAPLGAVRGAGHVAVSLAAGRWSRRFYVAAVAFAAVLEAEVLEATAEGGAELYGHFGGAGGGGSGEHACAVVNETT